METDKKKRQAKGSFYCKALFMQTWSLSAQRCYTTALAASAFVQVEKSPQIFHVVKHCLGKTSSQSSCIPKISMRLWIIILGRREVKAAEISPSPPPFFIRFAQQLPFGEKPSGEWYWLAIFSASRQDQHEFTGEQSGGRTQPPASPHRRLSPTDESLGAGGAHRPPSRRSAVSLPEATLVT